ncbi:hypothetical protein BSKO_02042 [Bryopsis sp. KO-2023]|nr:hypothetical protein BSKO_02042 [Bryopsis sp. KO-2023]
MASVEKVPPVFVKVDSLRPGSKGHNLIVKVIEAKAVPGRARTGSGESVGMSECLVGDETGIIVFTARGSQVDDAKVNNFLVLRNARVDMFKGSMRLAVNQWGTVEVGEGKFKVNKENNLSLVEYELVTINQ